MYRINLVLSPLLIQYSCAKTRHCRAGKVFLNKMASSAACHCNSESATTSALDWIFSQYEYGSVNKLKTHLRREASYAEHQMNLCNGLLVANTLRVSSIIGIQVEKARPV